MFCFAVIIETIVNFTWDRYLNEDPAIRLSLNKALTL